MGSTAPRTWFLLALLVLSTVLWIAHGASDDEALLARPREGARLALRTVRASGPAAHRLGGEPDLPPDVPWPSRDGSPMAFIAQIDLADVARVAPSSALPHEGMLSFFYDAEREPWGFDPADRTSHRVIWSHGVALARRPAPAELGERSRFAGIAFTVAPFDDPAGAPPMRGGREESLDSLEARENLFLGPPDALDLKVLGNANPIQGVMEIEVQLASNGVYMGDAHGLEDPRVPALEAGVSEWRLLLQVGSEGTMMWGDMGRLYFWIREADLQAARFDRTWVVLQCG